MTKPAPDDKKTIENLRGLIRRLEKSNQELGEENHRLKMELQGLKEPTGWD